MKHKRDGFPHAEQADHWWVQSLGDFERNEDALIYSGRYAFAARLVRHQSAQSPSYTLSNVFELVFVHIHLCQSCYYGTSRKLFRVFIASVTTIMVNQLSTNLSAAFLIQFAHIRRLGLVRLVCPSGGWLQLYLLRSLCSTV